MCLASRVEADEDSLSRRGSERSEYMINFFASSVVTGLAGDHVTSRLVFRILSGTLGMRDSDGRTKNTESLVALLTLRVVLLSFKRSETI